AHAWEAGGRRFIDLICSWGPLVAGHAHPAVVAAIAHQAERGPSYGMPSPLEAELAETIVDAFPSIEMVRFVSSGTEAAMSAIRLARAATGRDTVLKFAGGYHGHADALLAKAGSGIATLGLPDSAGVPFAAARDTLTVPYNDLAAARRTAAERDLAAIIVEPVAGNMGAVPPESGFLEGLRLLATECGALLIFDEVITGFRLARGGAQERLGRAAQRSPIAARVQRVGSLLTAFFTDHPVRNEDDALATDRAAFARFHAAMFRRGVLLPPSALECFFVSLAHDEPILDEVVTAADEALAESAG